jgi:putative ABC transport system permease protein
MPDWKHEVLRRLNDPVLARQPEVIEELAEHVEQRYRGLIARGRGESDAVAEALDELSDPSALARELRRLVPGPLVAPESARTGRRSVLATLRQDLWYAARVLRKNPGFTAVAVMALALGTGANTAIFSVVNTVMLRPLPFAEPDRLIRIWESNPDGGWPTFSASHPNFLDWRTRATAFERLAAITGVSYSLTSGEDAEIVRGYAVTADFLPILGTTPALGRNFLQEEDRPGGNTRVAIVSHGFWQRRFASDPSILQRTLTLNGLTYPIIGVLPDKFGWGGSTMDLIVPLAPNPARGRGDHRLLVIGRLKGSATLDQARTELTGIAAQLAEQYPASNRGWTVRLSTFYDWLVPDETRQALGVFAGAVLVVLLIACGNVANLLLARGAQRQREISIRAALGAERSRIVTQLLVEALLLAAIAGTIGIGIAILTTRLVVAYAPDALPRLDELTIDGRVLAFAMVSAILTSLIFGIVPALQTSKPNLTETLKEGTAGAGGSARRQRLRSALVVAEVALSVALLIGAGLLIRSFWRLQHVNPGFTTDGLLTMGITLPGSRYPTGEHAWAFYERLLSSVRALPGVQGAATVSLVPLGGGNTSSKIEIPGKAVAPGTQLPGADWRLVSPGYFRTLGIPLRGRDFADRDTKDAPPVAIISEQAARAYYPNEDALGRTIQISSFSQDPITIIGIANDIRSLGLDTDPGPMVYGSAKAFSGWNPMNVVLRSALDPASHAPAVRAAVRALDPSVPVYDIRPLTELFDDSLGPRRFNMYLLTCFAGVALLLACIGLFGVMAYLVSQRTHDIGVRLALGAAPRDVLRLILGQGLGLALAGAAIGVLGGLAGGSVMRSLLYSVTPTDVVTFVSVPLVLITVAVLACYVPARRAMKVDPLVALRSE